VNPIHANIDKPRLWEVEVSGQCRTDCGLKEGWTQMRLIRELAVPDVTLEQRVRFAILCAQKVCQDPDWTVWAENWLCGKDRSATSAWSVERTARAAAEVAWAAEAAAEMNKPLDLIKLALRVKLT